MESRTFEVADFSPLAPVTHTPPSERSTRRQTGENGSPTLLIKLPVGEILKMRFVLLATSGCWRSATHTDPSRSRSTKTAHQPIEFVSKRTFKSKSHFLIFFPPSHNPFLCVSRATSNPPTAA